MHQTTISVQWHRIAVCVAACGAGVVFAATGATAQVGAQARYQSEVQACNSGRAPQDTATCLKEARAAYAAQKKGQLDAGDGKLQANSVQRCDVFQSEAKAACLARISGRGSTSGSVAGGGILREVETVVVKPGAGPVRIEPKTADPVILVPIKP